VDPAPQFGSLCGEKEQSSMSSIYLRKMRRRVDFGRKKGPEKSHAEKPHQTNQPPAACDFFSEHTTSDPMPRFVNWQAHD
jgi:hypothetical protein